MTIPEQFTFLETLGFVGALTIALCSLPQVYESIKTGKTGMNGMMVFLWNIGAIQMLIYSYFKTGNTIICAQHVISIIFSGVILYYKVFPRKKHEQDITSTTGT